MGSLLFVPHPHSAFWLVLSFPFLSYKKTKFWLKRNHDDAVFSSILPFERNTYRGTFQVCYGEHEPPFSVPDGHVRKRVVPGKRDVRERVRSVEITLGAHAEAGVFLLRQRRGRTSVLSGVEAPV